MNNHSRAAQEDRLARLLPGGVRARLFLVFFLVLLPALLLLGWIYYQRYQTRLSQAMQTELEVSQGVAMTFATYIEGLQQQNQTVGQAIIAFPSYSEEKAAHLLSHAAQYPAVRNLSWVSPEGRVLASSLPALTGRDLSFRDYFQEIQAGKPLAVGDLMPRGVVTDAPTTAIATAIRDDAGLLRGVVVAGVEPARLHELALTQQRPAGGEYTLFDRQGVVVFNSSGGSPLWEQRTGWLARDTLLQRVLEGGEPEVGVTRLEDSGDEWIAARVPVAGTGWVAGARRPVDIALAPVRRGLFLDSLLALLVFVLATLLASLLARTISRPLLQLERDAQAMGAGEMVSRPDPWAPEEVRRLRSTVEGMAAGLIQRAEALRLAHERAAWLARFPDENPNPVARASADGLLLYCNPAAAQLPGWSYAVGQRLDDPLLSLVGRAIAQEIEVEQDIQFGDKDYSVSVMPFPAENYANLYGRDVTERKRAEEELRGSNLRNQHILESISDAFYSLDPQGYFTYVNQKAVSLWGKSPEELLGKNIWEVFPSGKGTESYWKMQQSMEERRHLHYESYSAFLDQWVEINLYPTDKGLSVYFLDVTERKKAEQAMISYADRLERSNRDLQEFAFMASHDLQEPLRKIDILGDIILQGSADLGQRQRDAIVRMRRAANRMRRMVDGLLQYSLAARGQAFEPVALSQTVAEVLAGMEFQIMQVEGCVEVGSLPVIDADPVQMRHLFQNLIDNAIKFHKPGTPPMVQIWARREDDGRRTMDDGPPTAGSRQHADGRQPTGDDQSLSGEPSVVGRLSSVVPTPSSSVELLIQDNGIGFDESRAHRLFQPFQRLVGLGENAGEELPGIGIGLPICRRIVERHGGEIRLHSMPGQGTTVIITLPGKGKSFLAE